MNRSTDLGPLPTEHPRARIVDSAEQALQNAYTKIRAEYELTTGEQVRVLTTALSCLLGNVAKYAIRHERHGSGDKPGDLK